MIELLDNVIIHESTTGNVYNGLKRQITESTLIQTMNPNINRNTQ
jgi:hypothetical protein